jgi:hypothetical protein
MTDNGARRPRAEKRRVAVAGGAGVVAGAGISTSLFGSLGLPKLLAGPQSHSLAYPVVLFCLTALFILVAALFTIEVSARQRPLVIAGIAVFALTALGGAGFVFVAEASRPMVTFTALVDPEWVLGDGRSWAVGGRDPTRSRLRLMYRAGSNDVTAYTPLKGNTLSVAKDGVIGLRIDGIEDLVESYQTSSRQSEDNFRLQQKICQIDPKLACDTFVAKDLPH